jgi:hypothetical protein
LATAPAIALARSEAIKTAALATLASFGKRLSSVLSPILASNASHETPAFSTCRRALGVAEPDGVEGDVYAPRPLHHLADLLLDGLFVEGVDHGYLRRPARILDVHGDRLERFPGVTGEEKDPHPFAGEGAGGRTAYLPPPPGITAFLFSSNILPSVSATSSRRRICVRCSQ